jgi:DNA-binding transcriptional MerR regulator
MDKAKGAFLTIGELAGELGLPQHILRYWETRFPQLRPLQRSGNRRYYRPADVALARQIHRLLNVEGFTVKGAQKALAEGWTEGAPPKREAAPAPAATDRDTLVARLESVRNELAKALGL